MCMIDMADGMSVVVLHSSNRKANKEHRCGECRRTIVPGEKYLNEGLLWEGEKSTHKTCRHCEIVRDWLIDECGGFIYGGIKEDIREHAWEGYGIEVKMMAVGMERSWTRKDGKPWRLPRLPKVSGHSQAA